jgi:hypothetical protein
VAAEQGQIGVLADLDRADAAGDAELVRGVDGDQGQRLVVGELAVAL